MEVNAMQVIGIDLGGTKLTSGLIDTEGGIQHQEYVPLEKKKGAEVAQLIKAEIARLRAIAPAVHGVGIAVPGIYSANNGRVWAPNIPEWEDYPLLDDLKRSLPKKLPVRIDSDRACYILGETWQGAARGSRNAIFLAIGTGIGAGLLVDGRILRGQGDIAGAVGWLALNTRHIADYSTCGCFEFHGSGTGLAHIARGRLQNDKYYNGQMHGKLISEIGAPDLFQAYDSGDPIATAVLNEAITYWGLATANLISTFNPEVVVFGGGVFGPGERFLNRIIAEARLWAQPIAMAQVRITVSSLGQQAGLLGAGRLAFLEE